METVLGVGFVAAAVWAVRYACKESNGKLRIGRPDCDNHDYQLTLQWRKQPKNTVEQVEACVDCGKVREPQS